MIRALATKSDGRPIVMLGLQPENFDRLKEGQPIKVNLRHLGEDQVLESLPDIDVVIFFADEETTAKLKENMIRGISIKESNES